MPSRTRGKSLGRALQSDQRVHHRLVLPHLGFRAYACSSVIVTTHARECTLLQVLLLLLPTVDRGLSKRTARRVAAAVSRRDSYLARQSIITVTSVVLVTSSSECES